MSGFVLDTEGCLWVADIEVHAAAHRRMINILMIRVHINNQKNVLCAFVYLMPFLFRVYFSPWTELDGTLVFTCGSLTVVMFPSIVLL